MTSATPQLSVKNLTVCYGPAQVLHDLSYDFAEGSVTAVLGPNGAGKSTLARALTGLVPIKSGTCTFDGTDITDWPPYRIRRSGLVHVPEGRGIFPGLSVLDNLLMAVRQSGSRRDRAAEMDRVFERFPVLAARKRQRAGSLSGGEQQMLALGRALAVRPRLIIADEMSLGLAPLIVEEVFQSLDIARKEGVTIVLIEQFIHRALAFADQCAILVQGKIAWSGPSSVAGSEVLDRYMGHHSDA